MNDAVADLVRLAGSTGAIDTERFARVRAAVHQAWRSEIGVVAGPAAPQRRWLVIGLPLGVAATAIIALLLWGADRAPAPVPPPVRVGQIDYATGSLATFAAGGAVMSGSTVTTSSGTLAITLTTGVHLRLDVASAARVDSATDVTLERGAVYVDSADAHLGAGASPISIHAPAGLVRDIGTQFEVRIAEAGMRIRVRDGQVRVTYADGVDDLAAAGEELFIKTNGSERSIDRRPIAVTGREWEWAERAAPPFSAEGKTLGTLLDWVSREGAWTVAFGDRGFSSAARATLIHGRPDFLKGLTPTEVLDVILPASGLRHRIDGHRVVIERDPRAGAGK